MIHHDNSFFKILFIILKVLYLCQSKRHFYEKEQHIIHS